jgi:hypothetical protein
LQLNGTPNGTEISYNEFTDIRQSDCDALNGNHCDSFQITDATNTWIHHNYIHDASTGMLMGDHPGSLIEHNVITNLENNEITIWTHCEMGIIVRHNTLRSAAPRFQLGNCSTHYVDYYDNISSGITLDPGVSWDNRPTRCHHNLSSSGIGTCTNTISGSPTYVGGSNPSTYAGFELTAESLGKGNASDSLDRGAIVVTSSAPSAPHLRIISFIGAALGLAALLGGIFYAARHQRRNRRGASGLGRPACE